MTPNQNEFDAPGLDKELCTLDTMENKCHHNFSSSTKSASSKSEDKQTSLVAGVRTKPNNIFYNFKNNIQESCSLCANELDLYKHFANKVQVIKIFLIIYAFHC